MIKMKSIEVKELIGAMEELEQERGIKKEYLLESLETALVTAYKRNFDSAENVKVTMDVITGNIRVFSLKQVVENVEDDMLDLKVAKRLLEKYNLQIYTLISPKKKKKKIKAEEEFEQATHDYYKHLEKIDKLKTYLKRYTIR